MIRLLNLTPFGVVAMNEYRRIEFVKIIKGANGLNTLCLLPCGSYSVTQGHSLKTVGVTDSNIYGTLEAALSAFDEREEHIASYFRVHGTALD